jgi:dTDP-4-dehydrorhamnose 3,5-epimerase
MIDGVQLTPLKQFLDGRGKVMRMIRSTDPHFKVFGEIYFSTIYPGAIKGWHLHKTKTINIAVPLGVVKAVTYDARLDSPTKGEILEVFLGPENYQLLTVPPMIWYGFQGIGTDTSIIANCATEPHALTETERRDPFSPDIPYKW